MSGSYKRIYAVIRRIPRGRVATYGQIARIAGLPNQARQVGYALSALEDDQIPWQRVVNAKGEISLRSLPGYENRQRTLLIKEGVRFNAKGQIALDRFQWKPQL